MSLLMEALRKAEQAKQSGENPPDGSDALRLEPIDAGAPPAEPAASPVGKQLPDLPAQLEVLDAEFMAHAQAAADKRPQKPARPTAPAAATPSPGHGAATPPRSSAAAEGERQAARQVFAAKQPVPGRNGFAIAVGTLALVGTAAIGGYFWWQLQPKSGLVATPGLARSVAPPGTPPAALAPAALAPVQPPPVQPAARPQSDAFRGVPPAPIPGQPAPDATDGGVEDTPAPRRAARRPAAPVDAEGPVRITTSRLKLNPALSQGFEALNAGDLASAEAAYDTVLRVEPRNSDALHGLAAIALRQGNVARAEALWGQALEADPKDALAQAALIGSGARGGADPQAQESRLKTLIAAQPETAALHFALGNVFARQSRWNEAQQAYFKAFNIEPEQPDYLFNLAVALDHLRQPRLAAQYYEQALAAAGRRPIGFDKGQAAARLRELQP